MQPFDNDNLKRVFERYNEAFAAAYDRALNADETYENISTANAAEELRNSVCNSIQNWHEMPLLDNQDSPTCGDVISAVATLEGALELARYGAAFCDDELPDLVKIKLASFGQPLIDELLAFVLATDFTVAMEDMKSENLDIAISAEFLKLLGDWQCDLCIEPVLTRFAASGVPNDMLADAVRYFLTMTGDT